MFVVDGEVPGVMSGQGLADVMEEICTNVSRGDDAALVSGCNILLRSMAQSGGCTASQPEIQGHMRALSKAAGIPAMIEPDDVIDTLLALGVRDPSAAVFKAPTLERR
jgi:hypothetical protein